MNKKSILQSYELLSQKINQKKKINKEEELKEKE